MESRQGKGPPPGPPAHLPSEHVLLSSPADAAGRRGALLAVLRHREAAFGARRRGPDLLRRRLGLRLGPGRLGRRRLGLASRALRPERHAAQPHEIGLETQPPPSPHRGHRERADPRPRRGSAGRRNLCGLKKVRVYKALRRLPRRPGARAPCSSGSPGPSAGPLADAGARALAQRAARRGGGAALSPARSTLHPPGHGRERLQDRQRAGAGNYKSNPSSLGVKLQRKRTSKEKKKGLHAAPRRIPVRSGNRSCKAAKVTRKKLASKQKSPPKKRVSSRLAWGPAGQRRAGGGWGAELRCAGPGRAAGEREGRRLDAGEDAAGERAARGF